MKKSADSRLCVTQAFFQSVKWSAASLCQKKNFSSLLKLYYFTFNAHTRSVLLDPS